MEGVDEFVKKHPEYKDIGMLMARCDSVARVELADIIIHDNVTALKRAPWAQFIFVERTVGECTPAQRAMRLLAMSGGALICSLADEQVNVEKQ